MPSRSAGDGRCHGVGAGSIGFLPASTVSGLSEADLGYVLEIGRRSGLPVVIQGLGSRSKVDAPTQGWERAVRFLDEATREGVPVYSMLMVRPFDRVVSFDETNHLWAAAPSWYRMTRLPKGERARLLRDPAAREEIIRLADAIGLRAWHAGPIDNAAAAEALTSILIFLNRHYKVDGAGIRITGVPHR